MTWYFYIAAVGFGLIFGSFLNVAIYRLPRRKSLDSRSRCPACGAVIRWYDNIPVASFLILRRRCRSCGKPISWRYPLVEISTAALFALMYWWSIEIVPGLLGVPDDMAFQPELIIGLVLVSVLIVITGCDLTHGIIPNKAVAAGLILMVPSVVGCALYRHQPGRIGVAALTSVAGSAFFLAAGLLYGAFFMRSAEEEEEAEEGGEREPEGSVAEDGAGRSDADDGKKKTGEEEEEDITGIGFGDIKLMLVTGLALGYFHWYLLLVHLLLSSLIAFLAYLPLMLFFGKGRKTRIPFGPFLAAGAILTLLTAEAILTAVWPQALA